MNLIRYVAITIGLVFVLVILLQLNTYLTGSWDTVAVNLANYSLVLWAFGICMVALFTFGRRR